MTTDKLQRIREATGGFSPSWFKLRKIMDILSEPEAPTGQEEPREWPQDLKERIYSTLLYYSNELTYRAPRIGGVLQGCPRGTPPTPYSLTVEACEMIRQIEAASGQAEAPKAEPVPGGMLNLIESHPNYVAGFKAGHAAGKARALAAQSKAEPAGEGLTDALSTIGGLLNVSGQKGLRHIETDLSHPRGGGIHIASGKDGAMLAAIVEVVNASQARKAGPPIEAKCSECGRTSTRDSMWALYCTACIASKIGPALAVPPAADDVRAALGNLLWQVDQFCEKYGEADFETGAARRALEGKQL